MFHTPKQGTTPASTNAPSQVQHTTTQKPLVFSPEGTAITVDSTARRLNFNGMRGNNQSSNSMNAISNGFARITVK